METTLDCSTGNFSAPGLPPAERLPMAGSNAGIAHAPALISLPSRQPVADVANYLARRRPVAHYRDEDALWITLPAAERENVAELLTAFERVKARLKLESVSRACAEVLKLPRFWQRGWAAKTFRTLFDKWSRAKDWVILVNRSKCSAAWRKTSVGLPLAFLNFCARRFGQFKRADGKRQAVLAIKRQWRTGRNPQGEEEIIPGYEAGWLTRDRDVFPGGWHYTNITRQIKKHGLFTQAVRAMLHESNAAASAELPHILGTRRGLRFLEEVTFDDVRMDWLVLVEGQACELWLLVARDTATGMILGFVMHPATVREDGKATHLGLKQMKQLAGWMLERYPLPPYVVTWKIERGTATLSDGMRLALGELFGNRIVVSFTSMLGGQSPVGYKEKAKGNSRGKASHESHNRLFHTQGSFIAGQTGNRWDVRPADLQARSKEAVEIWQARERLPEHLRGQLQYPVLTLNQAREQLFKLCNEQNERTEHALEDFEDVVEAVGGRLIQRKEMPIERAARLVKGYEWTPVSPHVVQAFYEHTERPVVVKDNGEIDFQMEGRSLVYAHGGLPLVPGTKALAYCHPDDPRFLYLTNGKGSILGTWLRRDRVNDKEALANAFRYTATAKRVATEAAQILAAPEREQLAAMRAHNAELLKLAEFTDVTPAPAAGEGSVGSPIGAALTAVSAAVKADVKRSKREATAAAQQAVAALQAAREREEAEAAGTAAPTAADNLLAALRNHRRE